MSEYENLKAEMEKNPIKPLTDGFIVPAKFINQIHEREDGQEMPQVNNKAMIKQGKLKKDLKLGQDFEVVSYEVWDYIINKFGGGPEIRIAILPDGSPELSKLQLTVEYKSAKTQFEISRNTKVETFMAKVVSSMNIPRNLSLALAATNSSEPLEVKETLGLTLGGLTRVAVVPNTGSASGNVALQATMSNNTAAPPPLESEKSSKQKLGKRAKRLLKASKSKQKVVVAQPPTQETTNLAADVFTYADVKPHGLNNIGNTCYMNSALQCVLSLPKFIACLPEIISECEKPVLSSAFANFVAGYAAGRPEPGMIKRAIAKVNSLFSSYGQQDSQELFSFLIDGMHDEAKKGGVFERMFYGSFESKTKCANCGEISSVIEPFTTVSLPISTCRRITFIPSDIEKPMIRVAKVPLDTNVVLIARSRSGSKVVEQLDEDAIDHLAYETEQVDGKRIIAKLVGPENANICLPILLPIRPDSTKDEILDQIWEFVQKMWQPRRREDVRKSMHLDDRTPDYKEIQEFDKLTVHVDDEKGISDIRTKARESDVNTLEDLISGFTSKTHLDERNQWKCDKCKESSCATRVCKFKRLPDIVAFQIKRFIGSGRRSHRDNTPIQIPLTLSLTDDYGENIFELRSISNHSGTLSFGHYTAIGKRGEKWFNFNDNSCTNTTPPSSPSASAYIAFYARPFSPPPRPTSEENKEENKNENVNDEEDKAENVNDEENKAENIDNEGNKNEEVNDGKTENNVEANNDEKNDSDEENKDGCKEVENKDVENNVKQSIVESGTNNMNEETKAQ